MCCNSGASCGLVWPKCCGGMGVLGKVVGLSLCWMVCWYGGGLVCVWFSVLIVLCVGATYFHPNMWILCVRCFFMGLMGWSATWRDCGVMSGQ